MKYNNYQKKYGRIILTHRYKFQVNELSNNIYYIRYRIDCNKNISKVFVTDIYNIKYI